MTKTKYVVTAATGFDGRKEGEEFEAELTAEEEERYIERGSIRPADPKQKRKESSNA